MNANISTDISAKDGFENNHKLALMGLLGVALGLLALLIMASNASAAHYDWTGGPYTVAGTETYTNATIDATSITVPAGTNLVLTNVTLNFTTNAQMFVHGTLEIKDYDGNNATTGDRSIVQRLAGHTRYYFKVYSDGNLLFKNSEIKDCGRSAGGIRPDEGLWIGSTNATIIGSSIHGGGDLGVVVDSNAKASIINSTIYSNNQMGVFVYFGQANITGCTFYGQTGWAIFIQGGTAQANIKNIDAKGGSGVGVVWTGKADISDSYIHNIDTYGTYWDVASGHVNNTNISYNNWNGNPLNYLTSSTVDFNDCKIYNSRTYGLQAYSSTVTIKNSKLNRNSMSSVWYNGGKITAEKSEFSDSAQYYGIELTGLSSATIGNSTIERNANSGIISQSVTTLRIEGNKINKNSNNWGIIINSGNTNVDIVNNIMTGNKGGITVGNVPKLNIKGNKISQANTYGIWVNNCAGTMNGNTVKNVTNNYAVYLANQDNFRMDKNTFDNNQNDIYVYQSYVDITNSTFNGSYSRSIYFESAYTSTVIGNKFTFPRQSIDYIYSYYSNVRLFDKNTFNGLNSGGWRSSRGVQIQYINVKPIITNNTFQNLSDGFYMYDDWGTNTDGLLAEGNKFIDIDSNGIYMYPYHYQYSEMKFNKNSFLNVQGECIHVQEGSLDMKMTFSNNNFENVGRAIYNYHYYDWWWWHFNTIDVNNNTINNTHWSETIRITYGGPLQMTDNKVSNTPGGIYVDGQAGPVTVLRTDVTDSNYGMRVYFWTNTRSLTIKDSKFNNNTNDWAFYASEAETAIVDNSDFSNSYGGLYLSNNYYGGHIRNCTFIDNNNEGLHQYYVYPWGYQPVMIENNMFSGNYYGYFGEYSHFIIRNNAFQNNTYGSYVVGGWSDSTAQFYNNKYYDNKEAGIYNNLYGASMGSGAWNNEFLNNDAGVRHYSDNTNFVYHDNTFRMGTYGIDNYGYGNAVIWNNDFRFLSIGIYLEEASGDIDGNTFSTIWTAAIKLDYVGASSVTNNKFTGCNKAVDIYDSMLTLEGNTYTGNSYGVNLEQGMAFMTRETFSDNTISIYVSTMSIITMEDVIIEQSGQYGIQSPGQSYMTLVVKGTSRIEASPIQMYGDISIENGGTLTIDNTKIDMYSPGGTPYTITVNNGGTLVVKDSQIVAFNITHPYGLAALAGSSITITDSVLKGVGYSTTPIGSGLYISGEASLDGLTIDGAVNGMYITGGADFTMRNSTIVNATEYDIWIQNASTLRVGNTKFDKKHVMVLDTSKIIIDRIIRVSAIDDARDPYEGVSVTVTSDGTPVGQGTTDEDGVWFEFFEGAIISKDGYTETLSNYTVVLTDGIQTFNDSFVLTDDYDHVFEFGVAPVIIKGPTPLTVPEDTELVIDLGKYFEDNDTMTYSVKGQVSLMVTIDGNRATILGAKDWFGTETITLVATDSHKLSSSYDVVVVVTPVNDVPALSGVPNLIVDQGQDYVLDLTPYINDPDTPFSALKVTVSTQYATVKGLTVTFKYPTITIEYVRISVKDAEGGTAQDILVSVQAGHYPPKPKGLPEYFNATEDVEEEFDLAPYIDNGDLNMSSVILSSTAKEIVMINGTKITVLFPNGELWRTIPITMANPNGNKTYQLKFYVLPVNDAPVLADLPPISVTEELDYVLDLTPYVSDIDNTLAQLTVTTNRTDIKVEGMLLIINIKDSGNLVTVSVTVTDGFQTVTKTLRITVININDQPVLDQDKVSRTSGTTTDRYTFTVRITDPDTQFPTVYVIVDGQRYTMRKVSGEYGTGAQYTLTMKLKAGDHSYHFEADDGSGAPNSKAWTPEQTHLSVSEPMNWLPLLILIIILVVVAAVLLVMKARSKAAQEPEVEEEAPKAASKAFTKVDEEEEEEPEEEPEEVEAVEEAEPVEEPKSLKTKASAADLSAQDAEASSVKPRKAKDLNLPKTEDMDKVEPEAPKVGSTLSEKASEGEAKGDDLDSLMKEIKADSVKRKKKKVE
jgi:hypothetical protein